MIKYSFIMPTFNSQNYIQEALDSILSQNLQDEQIEIILVDDCSSDDTINIIKMYQAQYSCIKCFSTTSNSGPGIARNKGIQESQGQWIFFIDSDDWLNKDAIKNLNKSIKNSSSDIISFNFKYSDDTKSNRHRDFASLSKNKEELLEDYLSLYLDGSVIYTLISSKLIKDNNIMFEKGYHEDIDFLFEVYYYAQKINILDERIYVKNNRDQSIVNTITDKHIQGFFRAYKKMFNFMKLVKLEQNQNHQKAYYSGVIGLTTILIRKLYSFKIKNKKELYVFLMKELENIKKMLPSNFNDINLQTKYFIIYKNFIDLYKRNKENIENDMRLFMEDIKNKSWSCYDLQHSLFLSYDKISTCCKRFFVDNKIKGDVVLLDTQKTRSSNFTLENIRKSKIDLYTNINKDKAEECKGCPYLEFKEWSDLNKTLDIGYLSLEYHSVCNMKCTYCSDKYYGGERPQYDVKSLLEKLIKEDVLSSCKNIVWGGGEPTLNKDFDEYLDFTVKELPITNHKIITNSTVFKPIIKTLLDEDKISITTSIDAGTSEVFNKVRNFKSLEKVLGNLVKYSKDNNQRNITIKYIIMDENNSLEEIKSFIANLKKHNLLKANIQISYNFKREDIDYKSSLAIIMLYCLLKKENAQFVFFDDLLRNKFSYIRESFDEIHKVLKQNNLESFIISKESTKKIVIWGAGFQTQEMVQNAILLKDIEIAYIVDNTLSKIGTEFLGYKIYDPKVLIDNDLPILISAVQASPIILKKAKELGLKEDRIINKLVL